MGTLKKRLIFQAHLGCDFIPTTVTNKGPLLGSQILVTRFTKKMKPYFITVEKYFSKEI